MTQAYKSHIEYKELGHKKGASVLGMQFLKGGAMESD